MCRFIQGCVCVLQFVIIYQGIVNADVCVDKDQLYLDGDEWVGITNKNKFYHCTCGYMKICTDADKAEYQAALARLSEDPIYNARHAALHEKNYSNKKPSKKSPSKGTTLNRHTTTIYSSTAKHDKHASSKSKHHTSTPEDHSTATRRHTTTMFSAPAKHGKHKSSKSKHHSTTPLENTTDVSASKTTTASDTETHKHAGGTKGTEHAGMKNTTSNEDDRTEAADSSTSMSSTSAVTKQVSTHHGSGATSRHGSSEDRGHNRHSSHGTSAVTRGSNANTTLSPVKSGGAIASGGCNVNGAFYKYGDKIDVCVGGDHVECVCTKDSTCVMNSDAIQGTNCTFPFVYLNRFRCSCINTNGVRWCSLTKSYDTDGRWEACPVGKPKHSDYCQYKGEVYKVGEKFGACVKGQYKACTCENAASCSENADDDNSKYNCTFPFKYNNEHHCKCIPAAGSSQAWCSLTSDYNRDKKFAWCNQEASQIHQTRKDDLEQCEYKGRIYKQGDVFGDCFSGEYVSCNCNNISKCNQKSDDNVNSDCVFPFKYNSQQYCKCIPEPSSSLRWCSLTADYSRDKRFKWCNQHSNTPKNDTVYCNHNGHIYKADESFGVCINGDYVKCNCDNIAECAKKADPQENSNCTFPFKYNGNQYCKCVPESTSSTSKWCSLTSNYNRDGKRIWCKPQAGERTTVPASDKCSISGKSFNPGDLYQTCKNNEVIQCVCGHQTCVSLGRKLTSSGYCKFPFRYNNADLCGCQPYAGKSWCMLEKPFGGKAWDYCI